MRKAGAVAEKCERFSITAPFAGIGRLRCSFAATERMDEDREFLDGRVTDARQTAGYMLRGFFTNLRRHVHFEQECLRGILAQYPVQPAC